MSRCGRTHEAPQSREVELAMGARDPTAGELGSNFATKVQGHADTEHVIKVSARSALRPRTHGGSADTRRR